ncbi:Nucleolar GTP-binding protein 2 [Porphyridium purpureum]|uniref:Nucleolar GTP-binding protein 2 n=1 Tax=Porphyridium purpureum TaxID=35688 RepID=A0A5J4Z8Q6_PORPP|nr:Nucleolar GTP-binding protein 2 [Porphyridium purpureum]|eukprot:POR5513..scf295_1
MPKQRVRTAPGVNGHRALNSDDVNRGKHVAGSIGRDRATVKRLQLYRTKSVKRDRNGKIKNGEGDLTSRTPEPGAGRTAPNRKWFGNTRVVDQTQLERFREQMGEVRKDNYQVVLKTKTVPTSLFKETTGRELMGTKLGLLQNETFEDTFSSKHWRKRPKIAATSIAELAGVVGKETEAFDSKAEEKRLEREADVYNEFKNATSEAIFDKGQSKRIWGELHKVLDSSDVVLQVIDARDPMGTRCLWLERFIKRECPHKHIVLILNKADLVPQWVAAAWLRILSKDYPTVAFHSSITNSYGKGTLINLLRQFGKLHADRKTISCGLVGYPNVGKSSVINTLSGKKVANVAPIPGETKVWQYITLFKKIYLIDCPGVVHESGANSEAQSVLKGVVRVESLKDFAPQYIEELLKRVETKHVIKTYGVLSWKDADDFLEQFAKKSGKLLKKGEPDVVTVARMVLLDYQRGKLPWFVAPPLASSEGAGAGGADGAAVPTGQGEDGNATLDGVRIEAQDLRALKSRVDNGSAQAGGSESEHSELAAWDDAAVSDSDASNDGGQDEEE